MNNRTTIEQSQRLPISFQNRPKYDNFRRLPKRPLHPPPTSIKMSIGSTKRPYLTATKKSPYPFLLFSDSIFPVIPTYDGRKNKDVLPDKKVLNLAKQNVTNATNKFENFLNPPKKPQPPEKKVDHLFNGYLKNFIHSALGK